jgi:ubiquinone/menaquinone biosynthesis C-methylase UbiE
MGQYLESLKLKLLFMLDRVFKPIFKGGLVAGWIPFVELIFQSWEEAWKIRSQWLFEQGRRNYTLFFRRVTEIRDKEIIDIGCGDGCKTWFYGSQSPKKIVGVDLDLFRLKLGQTFRPKSISTPPEFVLADATSLPFKSESFNICIMDDVMEHIKAPMDILKEARRILRNHGLVYITFTSYNAPHGGHLFEWISIPWVHFLFPERILERALYNLYLSNPNPIITRQYPGLKERTPGFVFADLNKMTARKFLELTKLTGFQVKSLQFSPFFEKKLFYILLNHILPPLLADFLSRQVVCVMQKES